MKRLVCVLLAAVLFCGLFAGCNPEPKGEIVVQGSGEYAIPADGSLLPDYARYLDNGKKMYVDSWGTHTLSISDKADFEPFEAYVKLLQDEFGFKVTRSKQVSGYQKDPRSEYTLERTDEATGSVLSLTAYAYLDKSVIDHTYRGGVLFTYPAKLSVGDTGHRYQKERVPVLFPGASAGASLLKMEDGTYRTDDGRFSVEVGKAAIRRGDDVFVSEFTMTEDVLRQHLKIRGDQKNTFYFRMPVTKEESKLCWTERFYQQYDSSMDIIDYSFEDAERYLLSMPVVLAPNGKYLTTVSQYSECKLEDVVFRKLYEDADGTCVYYIYVKYKSEDVPVEIFGAVKPTDAPEEIEEVSVKATILSSKSHALKMDISDVPVDAAKFPTFYWSASGNDGEIKILSGPGEGYSSEFTFKAEKAGEVYVFCDFTQEEEQGRGDYEIVLKRKVWKITVTE